jgi:hypothetical protein
MGMQEEEMKSGEGMGLGELMYVGLESWRYEIIIMMAGWENLFGRVGRVSNIPWFGLHPAT